MKKVKFFLSLLKERDWLEEMAAQGWVLTDITFGIIYDFKESQPCQKVFEVEHFGVSASPTVQELNARDMAMDIAIQSGWEMITHDEDMNYYFMKDKANDETDEFYDDEDMRKERAERYRRRYSYESPLALLSSWLTLSVIYILLFLFFEGSKVHTGLMWFYILFTFFEISIITLSIAWGQKMYGEFSLSREEWNNRKRLSEKNSFGKVQQLRVFLQEKSEKGLSFISYEGGKYLFEEDNSRYDYFVDTKACLKKRLKEQGVKFKNEEKDWSFQSLKWYETSIKDSRKYGLKLVGIINREVLIYKRPHSDENIPWENGNENIGFNKSSSVRAICIILACFLIGIAIGFIAAAIKSNL